MNPGPVKALISFLHAYFLIKFSSARQAQKQSRFAPYPLRFHLLAGVLRQAILQMVDTRHGVYQESSARHNGLLIPGIRQPWHTVYCHL